MVVGVVRLAWSDGIDYLSGLGWHGHRYDLDGWHGLLHQDVRQRCGDRPERVLAQAITTPHRPAPFGMHRNITRIS